MFVLQLYLIERVLDRFYSKLPIVVHIIRTRLVLSSSEQVLDSAPTTGVMARTVDFNTVHIRNLVIRNLQLAALIPVITDIAHVVHEDVLFDWQTVLIDGVVDCVAGLSQVATRFSLGCSQGILIALELLDILVRGQAKV